MMTEKTGFGHIPVLLDEAIDALNIKEDGIYVDGTAGGGGHSYEIAVRLGKNGRLICIDKDSDAIEEAGRKLAGFKDRTSIVKNNFAEIKNVLKDLGIGKVNGILLDLGVSSHQLDSAERGFSYMADAPLDMRMDRESGIDAKTLVNTYSEEELFRVIKDYGEERFAGRIARMIVKKRSGHPIETTGELAGIIREAYPAKARNTGKNPAMRTFQAIRIEVNDELGSLKTALEDCMDVLDEEGRLAVITFHSLEDRMVKNFFRDSENPCTCPPNFPVCVCHKVSKGRVITRKSIVPKQEELDRNTRAHSARLRVFERKQRYCLRGQPDHVSSNGFGT